MCFTPFLVCVRAYLHELAVVDHIFIVGRALWSAQGDDVFRTLLCLRAGMHSQAVGEHTFVFSVALQFFLGDNGALHTLICYEPECFHGPCC